MKKNTPLLLILLCGLFAFPVCAAEQSPQRSLQWQSDYADGLFVRGMYDSALKEYEKLLKDTNDADKKRAVEFKIAETYFKKRDLGKAADSFRDLEEKYTSEPARSEAAYYQGLVSYEMKKYEQALEHLGRVAVDALPPELAPKVYYYRGLCLKMLTRQDEAIAAFEAVADNEVLQIRGRAMQEIAVVQNLSGDNARSSETLEAIAREYPDMAGVEKIYLALGRNYFEIGNFQQSLESFYKAETKGVQNKDRVLLDYGIIKNVFQLKDFDSVIGRAEPLLKQQLDDGIKAEVMYLYAVALYQKKDLEKAGTVVDEILREFPKTPFKENVLVQGLWIAYERRDRSAFNTYLKRLDSDHADSLLRAEGYFLKGELLYENKEFADAADAYTKVFRINPVSRFADPSVYKNAQCLKAEAKPEEAYDAFRAYTERGLTPVVNGQATGDAEEKPLYLRQALLEAIALGEELGRFDDVLGFCGRFLDQFSSSSGAEEVLVKKAQMELELGKFEEMHGTLTQVLERFPATTRKREVLFNLGRNAVRLERYPEAVEHLTAAGASENVSGLVDGNEITLNLGIAQYFAGDYDQASKLLAEAFAGPLKDEITADILLWLGEYLGNAGDHALATEMYQYLLDREGVELNITERILYKLATWQFAQQEWQAALASYESFIQKFPDSELVLFARLGIAECKESMGLVDEAEPLYQELSNAEVPYVKARANRGLGNIYLLRGNKEEAVRSYMFVTILFDDEMVPELMLRSAQLYIELGQYDNAQNVIAEFKQRYPDHALSKEISSLMSTSGTKGPPQS
jgi:tetratricopeptide (TPR) repeat protein